MEKLIGRVSGLRALKGHLSDAGSLKGYLTLPSSIHAEYYSGPYDVTPRLTEQVLETNDKTMLDDVTIYQIPITYTSNPYDGKTVVIG